MSAHIAMPRDFMAAAKMLGRRNRAKIGHNTYLIRYSDRIAVRYHRTDIVTLWPTTAKVNNGGWFTATTRARIGRFLRMHGFDLFSSRGEWVVNGEPYVDGMTFSTDLSATEARKRRERWQIAALEVWGNARDGYEVNDQVWTDDYFECRTDAPATEMLKELRRALGHRADARGYTVEIQDGSFYAYRRCDGKPAYFARHVDA